jgi:acylphosphatase
MVRSLQCLISGKVQGVMFRSWVLDQAQSLNVTGWVRNLSDGKVELLAQGDEDKINELRVRVLAGANLSPAKVENVECQWLEYDKKHTTFEMRN